MKIAVNIHMIQHDDWVTPGEYLSWARRNRHAVTFTRCWRYEPLPASPDADMLVILGGLQCPATTRDECAYFDSEAEKACIRQFIEAGRMVIGVCLGAQLVGEALGAAYLHSPEREVGPVRARLTRAGRDDPLFSDFPDTFDAGEWHNDMPGLTEDSVVIASSDGCPRQIVRYGDCVYGFQTHMEFTRDIIEAGLENVGEIRPGPYVQSRDKLLGYDYTEMNRLLSTFLDRLVEYSTEGSHQRGVWRP